MTVLLSGIVGGLVAGSIAPFLLQIMTQWKHERRWAKPRKTLLKAKLDSAKGDGWVSLERLKILSGTSNDECRTLLIGLQARGGILKSEKEGWALIVKQPLTESGENVEEKE